MQRARSTLFGALRKVFRMLPMNDAARDVWRQRFLRRFPTIRPVQARGLAAQASDVWRPRRDTGGPAVGYVTASAGTLPASAPATLVAFYLPQFHPIPENDAWWGAGFTEWRNVSRALPQFEGHAQPRLPGELGFYDLRLADVMRRQAELAAEHGVGAFCFYFYWFGGKTLLEAPLRQWLQDPRIRLPFCLCWANENWSRRWDGREDHVLIQQQHSADDDLAFIAHIAPYLRDSRYLRVDGKPMLLVYRPALLPDPAATAQRWRNWCRTNGVGEIHLAYIQSFDRPDPRVIGFDAAVEFPPNMSTPADVTGQQRLINPDYSGTVLDWRELARSYLLKTAPPYRLYPGVNCGWDNEARRPGTGRTFLHASPRGYRDWLQATIGMRLPEDAPDHRLVFINAWNEWAEGAVLEPDARLGRAWLQATRQALQAAAGQSPPVPARPCVLAHAWYMEALPSILRALRDSRIEHRLIVTCAAEKQTEVEQIVAAHGLKAEIVAFANQGRDILPFLEMANRLLDEGEDVVLKLHTKRSTHRSDGEGDQWRDELLAGLLANGHANQAIAAFTREPELGLLTAPGHLQEVSQYIGANATRMASLCTRAGIEMPDDARFAAGSMFWVRLSALRPLLDLHPDRHEFEQEAGQIDGTFAHAIERFIGIAVQAAGYRITLLGEPTAQAHSTYRYADPSH